MEKFWTNRRSNRCQITAYILPVMCSLLSLDSLNRLFRSIHRRCSVKNVFLKVSQISQEYTCVGVSFNKVEGQQLYQKRDSNTDISLWKLRHLQQHLYSNAFLNDCLCFSELVYPFSSLFGKFYPLQYQQITKYFFKCNNLIWSNAVISIMHKLKNVPLTFQSTLLLNSY